MSTGPRFVWPAKTFLNTGEHMKYLLIIGDGMADGPVAELGGKTPLEAANIPTIDRLAKNGILGSTINCPKPLPAGSETAILSIFGYDPRDYFTGRSPMEAAASGILLEPGDTAYRMNLVSLEDGDIPYESRRILSHSAGSIAADDALEAVRTLEEDGTFAALLRKAQMKIYPFPAFRQIPVQHGADNAALVTIPPHDHLGEVIGPLLPTGCENAKVLDRLMREAHRVLDHASVNERRRAAGKLPANGVWFWAQGSALQLPSFREKYGHWGGVISAVPLCHGIAALGGLEMVSVEGATGEIDTNFEGKRDKALELLHRRDMDFVCLHLEAPDECTHNGDLKGKVQSIEWLDSRILAPLFDALEKENMDYRVLLLSDHRTLMSTRGHDGSPVPFLLYDSRKPHGSSLGYSEKNAEQGPFVENGSELMRILFEQNNQNK